MVSVFMLIMIFQIFEQSKLKSNTYVRFMDAPQVAQWGPRMWRFLHSMAEKVGRIVDVRSQVQRNNEEKRLWLVLVQGLQKSMPCPLCRQHFREYVMRNGFGVIFNSTGETRRSELRKWLWTLHNHVRTGKSQPIDVRLDDVPSLYGTYTNEMRAEDFKVITEHLRRGMFQRWLTRDDMYGLIRTMDELWRLG
jgi:hypothetical protein